MRDPRSRARYIVAVWLLLLLGAGLGALQLGDAVKAGGFNDANGRSFIGQSLNEEAFGDPANRLSVVLVSQGAIPEPLIDRVIADVSGIERVTGVVDGRSIPALSSPTGATEVLQVGVAADNTTTQNLVPALRATVAGSLADSAGGDRVRSHVTGAPALDYDLNIQSQRDALHAELIAFPLMILVLLLVYRAVGPTVVTLVVAGICLAGAQGIGALLARWFDVSNMYLTGASLIGLAVSIDYCLFLISRYREFLDAGAAPDRALAAARGTAGHAIRFGGLSVIAALAALFIARNMVFSSIAMAGMIVTLIALAALSTLVPALITLLGPRLFALPLPGFRRGPRRAAPDPDAAGAPPVALRRPRVVAIAVLVPLLAAIAPLAGVSLRVPVASADILPADADSRLGVEAINRELDSRALFPTIVTFAGEAGEPVARVAGRADALARSLADDPGVAAVAAPGTAGEVAAAPLTGSIGERPFARILVTATDDPDGEAAHALIGRLREAVAGRDDVYLSGATAQGDDFDRLVTRSIPAIVAVVMLVSLLLLGAAFRSWLLPVVAVTLNAVVVAASMGLLSAGWRITTGAAVNSVTPVVIFAIVFGLSMDYMLLMASRMREEWRAGGGHRSAVAVGLRRTSGLVISAAVIMIGVFLSFTVAEISIVRELGIGLALAVAMDALVVRPFLLPAVLLLIGPRIWGRPGSPADAPGPRAESAPPTPAPAG